MAAVDENRQAVGDEPTVATAARFATQPGPGRSERARRRSSSVPSIVDPVVGVVKADIGIKDGRIVVDRRRSAATWRSARTPSRSCAYGLVATPGVVDSHVHLITPEIVPVALSAGVTTLITAASTSRRGRWSASSARSRNGRSTSDCRQTPARHRSSSLDALLERRAVGFKIHEDYGADPASDRRDARLRRRPRRQRRAAHRRPERVRSSSTTRSPRSTAGPSTPIT